MFDGAPGLESAAPEIDSFFKDCTYSCSRGLSCSVGLQGARGCLLQAASASAQLDAALC